LRDSTETHCELWQAADSKNLAYCWKTNCGLGAYYLTGLAVECALKSCLAREVKEFDFPDKDFVNKMYSHDLGKLFQLDVALWAALQSAMGRDRKLSENWSTVKDWKDGKRYDIVEESEARALYEASTEARSGVMEWIRGRW
jgi:hypothetical protein